MNITFDNLAALKKVPLFLDGSDGSMWNVRDNESNWDLCLDEHCEGFAERRFVKVSDMLAWIRSLPVDNNADS